MIFEVSLPHLSFLAPCSRHVVISFVSPRLTSAGKRRPAVSKVDDHRVSKAVPAACAIPFMFVSRLTPQCVDERAELFQMRDES